MSKFMSNDVEQFCAGLSEDDTQKWLDIANKTFSDMRSTGVPEEICSEKAVLKASFQFDQGETTTVPAMALMFSDKEIGLKFFKKEGEEEETAKLDMVGYSGGIIKDHWWWDDLVIDLEGVEFATDKFPILENHDTDRKVAFTGKPIVNENGIVADSETTVFLDNDISREFVANSSKGFPYQSSIRVQPSSIERLDKDVEVEVNGLTLKGPGTVFRKCEFKEMSVCVFGWDSNTSAAAFNKEVNIPVGRRIGNFSESVSDDDQDSHHNENNFIKEIVMDEAKLKEDHPELYQKVFALGQVAGKTDATTAFTAEKKELDTKFDSMHEKIVLFEKKDAIRSEKDLRGEATSMFAAALKKSDIPEHLFEKVTQIVSYTKFVEDGVLDKTKFAEAIDTEIQSWIDAGVSQTVMGTGFSSDADEHEKNVAADEKKVDTDVDTLLSMVQV